MLPKPSTHLKTRSWGADFFWLVLYLRLKAQGVRLEPEMLRLPLVPTSTRSSLSPALSLSPLLQEENQQAHQDEEQEDTNNGPGNDPWEKEG